MLRFPFKLVTLDVNGTLLRIPSVGQMYAEIAWKHGVVADPHQLQVGFRSAYKRMAEEQPNFGLGRQGWQAWWTAVVVETFKLVDAHGQVDAIARDLIRHFSTGKPWTVEDGAVDLLNQLKSFRATLGVISNTDPRLHGILRDHNLSQYFDFVLTSYEANIEKPNIDIFKRALDLSQKHSASPVIGNDALHIGNSYDLDYLPAQKAGWHSVLVGSKCPANVDCLIFGNLNELRTHLASLS